MISFKEEQPEYSNKIVGNHQEMKSGHLRVLHINANQFWNNVIEYDFSEQTIFDDNNPQIFWKLQNNGIEIVYHQILLLVEKICLMLAFWLRLHTERRAYTYLTTLLIFAAQNTQLGSNDSNLNTNESAVNFGLLSNHLRGQIKTAKGIRLN